MIFRKGTESDLVPWMELVRKVSPGFPGLETEEALAQHQETVLKFIKGGAGICAEDNQKIMGVLLFSKSHQKICFLAVDPAYHRLGVASQLLEMALGELNHREDTTVSTFREEDPKGEAPRTLYAKFGFKPVELTEEFGYPNQVFRLPGQTSDQQGKDTFRIRKAMLEDQEDVAKLASRLWPHHTPEELVEEFAGLLENEECAVFLAFQQGVPMGFAQCQLRHDYVEGTDSSPVGYLEGIFVDPSFQRSGVAQALLNACEAWAKEKGCQEFASDCEWGNEDSLAFHLAVGFTEANRIICFTKKLNP